MEWKDEYNIGVKEVDHQHQQLVKLINRYKIALANTKYDVYSEMGHLLIYLVNYANYHFASEEALMERIGYPDLVHHHQVHRDLIRRLKEVLLKLKSHDSYKPIEFYYFLMKWLTDHILGEDKKISEYYAKANKSTKTFHKIISTPEEVLKFFEPNFKRLELMLENKLIDDTDRSKKKGDFLERFYKSYSISDPGTLHLSLNSVNTLKDKGFLVEVEAQEVKEIILSLTNLEDLLSQYEEPKEKLSLLKYLVDDHLMDQETYDQKKAVILEKME